jgi:hypothetical protein
VERQATGGALFDKIEFDRGRSVRCPIRISVRRGEYPPRFRSTKCMMFARCRARRASTSLYPIVWRTFSLHSLVPSSDGPSCLLGTRANNIRRVKRCGFRDCFFERPTPITNTKKEQRARGNSCRLMWEIRGPNAARRHTAIRVQIVAWGFATRRRRRCSR